MDVEAPVETALREVGFSAERLLGVARDVANDRARRLPYCSEQTRQDLTSYLTETAVRVTLRYDASKSGDDYSFPSFIWDVLNLRTTDFFRRKSEGFGDTRSGSDNRVTLRADPLADVDHDGVWDDNDGLDEALGRLGERLSEEGRATLREIAIPVACGWRELDVARALGVSFRVIETRMAELREELAADGGKGVAIPGPAPESPLAHRSDKSERNGVARR